MVVADVKKFKEQEQKKVAEEFLTFSNISFCDIIMYGWSGSSAG